MASCIELDYGITLEEVVEVVASIAKGYRLEVGDAWAVVGEELIFESLLSESFVGIYGKRLAGRAARGTTLCYVGGVGYQFF